MACSILQPALDELLLLDGDFARQRTAAHRVHELLSELTAFDGTHEDNRIETVLPSGIALSPLNAASCVIDYPRTSKFAAGLEAAVRAAQRRFPGERIEIVYAGCGPFAMLALPLTQRFSTREITFTMLDIHARSLEIARGLFDTLGVGDYVTAWTRCDAATYVHPRPGRFHVLVSETMRKGLASEPQIPITLNLAPQMAPGGILVPECIIIGAAVEDLTADELFMTEDMSPAPEHGRRRNAIELGTVFEVTAALQPPSSGDAWPPVIVTVPADGAPPRYLMLTTRIRVFDNIVIDDYESGLTYPTVVRIFDKLQAGTSVEIRYGLRSEPGFRYRLI